jgi:hypothetical protein
MELSISYSLYLHCYSAVRDVSSKTSTIVTLIDNVVLNGYSDLADNCFSIE